MIRKLGETTVATGAAVHPVVMVHADDLKAVESLIQAVQRWRAEGRHVLSPGCPCRNCSLVLAWERYTRR